MNRAAKLILGPTCGFWQHCRVPSQFKRFVPAAPRKATSPGRWGGFILGALLGLAILPAHAQQLHDQPGSEAKWETLDNCRLDSNEPMDGDSFRLIHDGREYLVRLYFVDAPERDATLRERIQDQAAYFGIKPDDVPRAGLAAAKFTREKLTGKTFTVKTRWQNAMGRSSLARFYAIVTAGNEDLAEQLVANGLARIHGIRANLPGGPRSTTFISKLKNFELTAREKHVGVWNETQFPRVTLSDLTGPTNDVAMAKPAKIPGEIPAGHSPTNALELNGATLEELMRLPAIGQTQAQRIVAARPFTSVDDLQRVPGIGPKTLEKLRPLVAVAVDTNGPGNAH